MSDTRAECKICGNSAVASFDWGWHTTPRKRDDPLGFFRQVDRIRASLQPDAQVKFGRQYRCRTCQRYWYLDDANRFIWRVPDAREALYLRWCSTDLAISTDQEQALEAIGGVGTTATSAAVNRRLTAPCRVSLKDGNVIDPAIVTITDLPPLDSTIDHVSLFENVASVEESEHALPLDIRIASFTAAEVRMFDAPTFVVAPTGAVYRLNHLHSAFKEGDLRGKDMRLIDGRPQGGPDQAARSDKLTATFLYADWYDGAERILRM